jgi:hypothetical protein
MGLAREHYTSALGFGWLITRPEDWLAPPSVADDSGLARFCHENRFLITHACGELVHCQVSVITPEAKDRTP